MAKPERATAVATSAAAIIDREPAITTRMGFSFVSEP
jgi:hypothetical protein